MNVVDLLLNSWYELLNGNISKPVYRTSVPSNERGHYVLLRKESETKTPIKSAVIKNPVVVVDIRTRFDNMIDDSIVDGIDNEIETLYTTLPNKHNLAEQTGMHITSVDRQQTIYIDEDDGKNKLYRHVTRYSHSITQA